MPVSVEKKTTLFSQDFIFCAFKDELRFIKKKEEKEKERKSEKLMINFLGHLFNTHERERQIEIGCFFFHEYSFQQNNLRIVKIQEHRCKEKRISSEHFPPYLNDRRKHRSKTDVDNFVDDELNARLSICEGDDDVSMTFVVR